MNPLQISTSTRLLLKRLGLVLLLYVAFRLLFFLFNYHQYQRFDGLTLVMAFVHGLRFDLAAIFLVNSLVILLSLLPAPRLVSQRWYQYSLAALFVICNIPFFIANIADMEYYKFTGKRITTSIFLLKSETAHQLDQFIVNYWHLTLILLLSCTALVWATKRSMLSAQNPQPFSWRRLVSSSAKFLGVMALVVVVSRGGLQLKVIEPVHAFHQNSTEVGILTLNSAFTLLKSDSSAELTKVTYYPEWSSMVDHLPASPLSTAKATPPSNVVILILESMASEFWGVANPASEGYTPFLDSLSKKGLFFKNGFANGRRSIDALPSILFGVPALMGTPVFKSNYQTNEWVGLGTLLDKNGYHTSFFHGAPRGTMYFDIISQMAGMEDYYPLERYSGSKEDFDGHWGIYDEPFLQYMVKQLNQHKEPFFSVVFTISTHQPYSVPAKYNERFPEGSLKIHESVGYVDYAVQKFFEAAQKQGWYENTLFIITADHTQMSESEYFNNILGRYRVPLLFYHPGQDLPQVDSSQVVQQTDILPSVLDYLGLGDEPRLLFGRSVFDQTTPGEALFQSNKNYWLVRHDHFIHMRPDGEILAFDFASDQSEENPVELKINEKSALENRLKAYIQYFNNGLVENRLYKR